MKSYLRHAHRGLPISSHDSSALETLLKRWRRNKETGEAETLRSTRGRFCFPTLEPLVPYFRDWVKELPEESPVFPPVRAVMQVSREPGRTRSSRALGIDATSGFGRIGLGPRGRALNLVEAYFDGPSHEWFYIIEADDVAKITTAVMPLYLGENRIVPVMKYSDSLALARKIGFQK